MFSNTLKRSAATLGVVAGLLAAAVPASAMVGGDEADTVTGKAAVLTDYDRNSFSPQAPTSDGLIAVTVDAGSGNDNVKGPTKATAGGISGYEMTKAIAGKAPTNAGTQVGSEALALDDYGPHVLTLDGASSEVFELNTFGLTEHEGAAFRGEVTGLEPNALGTQVGSEGVIVGAARSGANNLRGEAIDIIP